MNRKLTLSPLMIFAAVVLLLAGELAAGTSLYFASMASLGVLCACITYNILGGLGSISGIAYTRFALSTLVVSQVGKVLVLERADQNLDVPGLTITVYAVYFASLMLGVFAFSRIRLPLPKPIEPETPAQQGYLYLIALSGGLIGVLWLLELDFSGSNANASLGHGFALVLSYLLPFSLVLAVDIRIRTTDGRHSFGWLALWPALTMILQSFVYSGRAPFLQPVAIVFLTCFLRKYHFRKTHLFAAVAIGGFFFFFVSPYYLYSRALRGEASISEQFSANIRGLESAPAEWATIKSAVGEQELRNSGLVNYFATPAAVTLNRFALIGPDSTLINACSTGFHYGFTSIKLDVLSHIPRFIYRSKSVVGSNGYLGHLDGQEPDVFESTATTVTSVADSFGGFSWMGAFLFPFLVVPLVFVVYESMFDMERPWGTVAMALLCFALTEGTTGVIVAHILVSIPAYVLALSWGAAWVIRLIPASGDRAVRARSGHTRNLGGVATPLCEGESATGF